MQSLDNLCANAIRVVSADAIQRANSGHPGMVMGAAPMGYALYSWKLSLPGNCPGWGRHAVFRFVVDHFNLFAYGHGDG